MSDQEYGRCADDQICVDTANSDIRFPPVAVFVPPHDYVNLVEDSVEGKGTGHVRLPISAGSSMVRVSLRTSQSGLEAQAITMKVQAATSKSGPQHWLNQSEKG